MSMLSKISRSTVLAVLLWAGVATLVIGFVMNSMWQQVPTGRLSESSKLAAVAFFLAWIVTRFSRMHLANSLAIVWGIALMFFVGILPVLTVLLMAACALALGSLIVAAHYGRSVLVPTMLGLGLIVGTVGWLLPFPLHYRWVYLAALVLPIFFRRREILTRAKAAIEAWRHALSESPRAAMFGVMIAGIASTGCWFPTLQFDDLGYHIGMPSQLALLGYYRFDVFSQFWAMAPWAGDIVQSVAHVSAGQEARGAVDAFWLLVSAALLWRLAATVAMPPYARWLASALYLSLPLTSALAGGMQAELPATTILLALALAVAEAPAQPDFRVFCTVSVLAALMLAIKTGFLAATIPIGIWLLIRWRARIPMRAILPTLALVIYIAASSYVYAYIISGNPMLPLFNGIFHSPLIPQDNFSGTPYKAGGGITSPWQMTFHTHLFSECWDGAAGMSFLGLTGASIAALFMRKLRPLALVATAAFLIPFEAINYYRYAYPALVLMIPVTVAAATSLLTRRIGIALLTMMIGLNLLYQGCSYYTLHDATFLKHKTWSKEKLFKRFAPERSMAEFVRQHSATDIAVFCDPGRPFYAELAGRGLTISSYDTELSKSFIEVEQDPSGKAWRGLFAEVGARYAVTTESKRSPALSAALSDASKVQQIGAIELWLLPVTAETSDLLQSRDVAALKFWP